MVLTCEYSSQTCTDQFVALVVEALAGIFGISGCFLRVCVRR